MAGETRGIAPNFIHSLDACHMRMVVTGLFRRSNVSNIWSVHDAFGCHPNHIDLLREVTVNTFAMVHSSNQEGRGILQELIYQSVGKELPEGDMKISDVSRLDAKSEPLSKYLIS